MRAYGVELAFTTVHGGPGRKLASRNDCQIVTHFAPKAVVRGPIFTYVNIDKSIICR